jgi:hypothetical protein
MPDTEDRKFVTRSVYQGWRVYCQPSRSYLAILFVWGSVLALSFRLFWCINRYAVNLFISDDWIFYDVLSTKSPWWKTFVLQDGPHREGLGVVLVSFMLKFTSWNSRVEGFAIGITIVLATVFAIYLKVRVFGRICFSDVIIPFMFLTLAQWEIFLGGPGPSDQAFPLLLTMAYCLAWIQKGPTLRLVQVLVINFLLIFTGFGLFIGAITLLVLAVECYHNARAKDGKSALISLVGLLLAAASAASFFLHYVFSPAANCFHFPYGKPVRYSWFMALMFARFIGIKHHLAFASITGFVILILLIACLIRHVALLWRKGWTEPASLVIATLIAYPLLYAFATAVGRICFGIEASQSSRYMTLVIPAFLGVYFHLLAQPRARWRVVSLAVLFAVVFSGSVQRNHKEMEGVAAARRDWKWCYLKTENVRSCNASAKTEIYLPGQEDQLQRKLQQLKQNRLNLYATPN